MNQFQSKPELPNSTAVLIMGIISLVTALVGCAFLPIFLISVTLSIVALVMAKPGLGMHRSAPGAYSGHGNLVAGQICAIVSLCLSVLLVLLTIGLFLFLGTVSGWVNFMGGFPR